MNPPLSCNEGTGSAKVETSAYNINPINNQSISSVSVYVASLSDKSMCIICIAYHRRYTCFVFVCLMVFNATFNNISIISWRSLLLMEENGGPGDIHRTIVSHWKTVLHNVVHLAHIKIQTHNISGDRH